MKKLLFFQIFLFLFSGIFAQKYTISGYVEDASTGEKLLGAAVYDARMNNLGTITNHYGFYSLTIPKMKIKLTASFVGYGALTAEFELNE